MSHAELACSYAALILADDGVEVTVRLFPVPLSNIKSIAMNPVIAGFRRKRKKKKGKKGVANIHSTKQADKLQTILKSANVQDVEPIWTQLFAKVFPHTCQTGFLYLPGQR